MYGSIGGKFASVSNTFMGSKMSSFHVVVELILELCNSLYIIGSKPIQLKHENYLFSTPYVSLIDINLPSMVLSKKSQGHISLLEHIY